MRICYGSISFTFRDQSIFEGTHADPFSVLGMHETEKGIEIRALLPDASRVVVIGSETHNAVCELEHIDERGFFAAVIPKTRTFFAYQLQVFGALNHNLLKILTVFIRCWRI